jgi:hypothetical protein
MDKPQFSDWTPSESAGVDQFLNTALGQKWLTYLYNHKPRTTVDKGTEAAALSGVYSAGYEFCMLQIWISRRPLEQAEVSAKSADMTKD